MTIIETSAFEELGRSSTYNRNNNCPSTEPYGIPQLMTCFTISAHPVIFIYSFLPVK